MYGDRIRQARELSALTQEQLAELIGVGQSAVAQIEAGIFAPSEAILQAIAMSTGFDMAFLRQEKPPAEFPFTSLLYRSQAKVSKTDKARAHRTAQLMFEIAQLTRAKLKDIPVTIPRLSEPPEVAAQLTRASLGFSPDTPIPNLVNAIERAGVLVFRLPLNVEGFDGFSAWVGPIHNIPVICLLGGKFGYRQRFTLSEELCHLVKHSPLRCAVKEADQEARQFAGELLLPTDAARAEITNPVTLSSLLPIRQRYGVSLQFAIRRAAELEIITANQYRYLMMQLSSKGWKKEEPGDSAVAPEQPRMFTKMIEAVYGKPPDLMKIKREMGGAPVALLRSLIGADSPADPEPSGRIIAFRRAS